MTHFLDIRDLSRDTLLALLDEAARRKRARAGRPRAAADADAPLAGHALAMVFEKPSTRTRVSFDIAMRQLGGAPLVFNANDMQLGRGETVADTARVLSRMVDAIMIRTFAHATIEELAKHAAVPVINGLTDHSHPCQIMADLLTLREHGKAFQGLKVAWLGDVNNVTHSWIEAAALLGMHFVIAAPPGLKPHPDVMAFASAQPGAIEITHDAEKA
ncbi:MAG TPA: ornithine carbamoyltransferase, partial [Thermopetrobacter sp.]|nr:ornithine carbamoyltransferase [Thermopetrobacter sp.]